MSQSNREPEGAIALGVRETVGSFSHAPWQISSSSSPDCAGNSGSRRRQQTEGPIEKNNGMLVRSLAHLLLPSRASSVRRIKHILGGRFYTAKGIALPTLVSAKG